MALWTGVLLAMLVLAPLFLEGRDLSQPTSEDAANLMQFLVVLCFPIFLFYIAMRYLEWRTFHIYNVNTIAFSNKQFRHRWVSLWHKNDEAVQGLRSLKLLNFDIFSKRFAQGPLSLLSVFILPVIVLLAVNAPSAMRELHNCAEKYGALSGVFFLIDNTQQFGSSDEVPSVRMDGLCNAVSSNLEKQNAKGYIRALKGNGQDIQRNAAMLTEILVLAVARATRTEKLLNLETFFGNILVFVCLAAAMLILALLITVVANFMVEWTSCFLSWTLNPVAIGQIRATALGSDTTADYAIDVDTWPMWLGNGYPPLPEPLGPQLQAKSDAAVSKVVPKFRNALRQFATAESKAEKSDMLSEYLTWDELIHTSYFHDAQFRKLVAFALTQAEGIRASEAFKYDPDFELVGGWYKDLIGSIQNVDVA